MNNIYKNTELFVFLLVLISLIFAPIFNAGNQPMPLMVLEIIGLLILALLVIDASSKKKIPRYLLFLSCIVLIIPWLYLVPITESLWSGLPGRFLYQETFELFNIEGQYYHLSLIPWETLNSALAIIPPVSLFLAIIFLAANRLIILAYVFLVIVGAEAVVGLFHYLIPSDSLPGWVADFLNYKNIGEMHQGDAHGTYANRDHFAALMAMGVSVCFAVVSMEFRRKKYKEISILRIGLILIVFLLIIQALIFSRSRAGIFLGGFSFIISSVIFFIYMKKSFFFKGFFYIVPISALLLSLKIGVIPTLNRFVELNPEEDARFLIFRRTIAGIKEFFPVGSGPGTYDEVYRRFQPVDQLGFINHAHNDYLELLFETGLIGMLMVCIFIFLFLIAIIKLYRTRLANDKDFQYLQTAAVISVLVLLLHGLVDFNFHIPANTLYFAFMLGIVFHCRANKKVGRKRGAWK
jgi:O-antigen ligase